MFFIWTVVTSLLLILGTCSACQDPWSEFNSTCYLVVGIEKPFADALTYCQSQGGTLASLRDENTHNWVVNEVDADGCEFLCVSCLTHAGASRKSPSDVTWKTLSQRPISAHPWHKATERKEKLSSLEPFTPWRNLTEGHDPNPRTVLHERKFLLDLGIEPGTFDLRPKRGIH